MTNKKPDILKEGPVSKRFLRACIACRKVASDDEIQKTKGVSFKYLTLRGMLNIILPTLEKHGLALNQYVNDDILTTVIFDIEDHKQVADTIKLSLFKPEILMDNIKINGRKTEKGNTIHADLFHTYGSMITYLRRTGIQLALNFMPDKEKMEDYKDEVYGKNSPYEFVNTIPKQEKKTEPIVIKQEVKSQEPVSVKESVPEESENPALLNECQELYDTAKTINPNLPEFSALKEKYKNNLHSFKDKLSNFLKKK